MDDGTTKNEKFYLKGLDERALCTDGGQITIGHDNRAWVLKDEKQYSDMTSNITGEYIVEGYENNKNNWHYVKIKVIDAE